MNMILIRIKYVSIGSAIMAAALIVLGLTTQNAWSAGTPVSDQEAAELLTECLTEDDDDITEESNSLGGYMCCALKLGYCIACPANQSNKCQKLPASDAGDPSPLIQITDPGNLAPTKDTISRPDSLKVLKNYIRRSSGKTYKKKKY